MRLRGHRRLAPLADHGRRRLRRRDVAGRRAGHRLGARRCRRRAARSSGPADVDGTPWSYALLTGSSSIFHSLRCAVAPRRASLGEERPDWELVGASNLADVVRAPARRVRAEAPLGDGLVLPGAHRRADRATPAIDAPGRAAGTRSCMDGLGVRCVSNEPWVTAAETAECALAHLAVGDDETAREPAARGRGPSHATTAPTGPASSTPTASRSPTRERTRLHRPPP